MDINSELNHRIGDWILIGDRPHKSWPCGAVIWETRRTGCIDPLFALLLRKGHTVNVSTLGKKFNLIIDKLPQTEEFSLYIDRIRYFSREDMEMLSTYLDGLSPNLPVNRKPDESLRNNSKIEQQKAGDPQSQQNTKPEYKGATNVIRNIFIPLIVLIVATLFIIGYFKQAHSKSRTESEKSESNKGNPIIISSQETSLTDEQILKEGRDYLWGENGKNIDKNKAFDVFNKLANKSYPKSYYYTAVCFLDGEGTSQNTSEGLKWGRKVIEGNLDIKKGIYERISKLADNCDPEALKLRADCCYEGFSGVRKDRGNAILDYIASCNKGHIGATSKLRDIAASNIKSKQNWEESLIILKVLNMIPGTNKDDAKMLGECLMNAGDYSGAESAFLKAKSLGSQDVNQILSELYLDIGKKLFDKGEYKAAIERLDKIPDPKNGKIESYLARCEAQLKNYKKAVIHYEKSAGLNFNKDDSYNTIGWIYRTKLNDNIKGYEYYKKAYDLKPYYEAYIWNIGLCHYYGYGTDKDKNKGMALIQEAAKKGYNEAINFIQKLEEAGVENVEVEEVEVEEVK